MSALARALLLGAAATLGGCGGGADNPPEEPAATVDGAELESWWMDRSPFNVGVSARGCEPGVVTAEYTIDSNGRVHGIRILASRPRLPRNESAVKDDLWERRYDPAPENPQALPVRVRREFVIDCGPGTPKWR
jgi:hypothetical protein